MEGDFCSFGYVDIIFIYTGMVLLLHNTYNEE